MRHFAALAVAALAFAPAIARAGGFELAEQSARGIAMAGAQTALADDASAVYYNPAGLTFQRGLGVTAGLNLILADTDVRPPNAAAGSAFTVAPAPTVFAGQRLGPHFAVGIGLFSNFAQHFDYGPNFSGRLQGWFLDLTTVTINPTVAIRPFPWISVGFGLDIVPATFEIRKGLSFGSEQGDIHIGMSAIGFGGNVGLKAIAHPRWLQIGVSYRSTIDIDLGGSATINAPPELAAMTANLRAAAATLSLPHNFAFALSSHLTRDLDVEVAGHLTLWHDLKTLTLDLTDPHGPPSQTPQQQSLVLDWKDSGGVRVGGEYRLLDARLALRLGVGWDMTPQPSSTLTPLSPDANRVFVSVGVGWRHRGIGFDLGYLAAILFDRTSTNPDYNGAKFSTLGHVIAFNVIFRAEDFLGRINDPAYKRFQ